MRKELSDYLLEHARQERFALTAGLKVELQTDERLELGEFGIQAQLLGQPEEAEAAEEPQAGPSAGDFGHTMVYSPDREARLLEPEPDRRQALLVGEGRRNVLSGNVVVVGRSRVRRRDLRSPTCPAGTRSSGAATTDGRWSTSARPTA